MKNKQKIIRNYKGKNNPFYGKKHTKESKEKMRLSSLGQLSWSKGLTKETDERLLKMSKTKTGKKRKPFSKETKERMRLSHIGKHHSKETREKIKLAHIGKKNYNYIDGRTYKKSLCIDCRRKISWGAQRCKSCHAKFYRLGKKHSFKTRKHMSLLRGGTGIPGEFSEYPPEFNEVLRNKIRARDNYKCQNCGMTQEEHIFIYSRDIEVHHIDYDKTNCKEINLIVLCKQCNIRANLNKRYWQEYYNKIIKTKIELRR